MSSDRRAHLQSALFLIVILGGSLLTTSACELDAGADYPSAGGYVGYPPDAYIATTEPWYLDGQACYWYGGFWYYRHGGRWGRYDHEPAALRARRLQGGQARHGYEPYGGRGGSRGGGRGGGRSGGHR